MYILLVLRKVTNNQQYTQVKHIFMNVQLPHLYIFMNVQSLHLYIFMNAQSQLTALLPPSLRSQPPLSIALPPLHP